MPVGRTTTGGKNCNRNPLNLLFCPLQRIGHPSSMRRRIQSGKGAYPPCLLMLSARPSAGMKSFFLESTSGRMQVSSSTFT